MKILIYSGEGVSPFSLAETLRTFRGISSNVEAVDHTILNETDWEEKTKLLVFPGGRDIPFDRNLKGKGTKKIRTFVENGGSYLGICAGAYFACKEVIFEKGTPIEVHEKRELAFFPGAAIGTLYPEIPFSYTDQTSLHPAHISFENDSLYLYYNGGCTFKNPEGYKSVAVLARYLDADLQSAIIHCKVGKGNAILSGVHFEICLKALQKEGASSTAIDPLQQSDDKRKRLITTLLSYLL